MQKRIIILLGVLLGFFFSVGGYFINKHWHKYVKNQPKMFVYETFRGESKPVSVLIIEDLKLKKSYLNYYKQLENGIEPILDNKIPLKGMPQYSPVYVLEYTEDSLLVEIVSYHDRGAYFGGNYTKGWVYAKTLHKKPFK